MPPRSYLPKNIRRCQLGITLTDAEYTAVYRAATREGKPLAVWAREILLAKIREKEERAA